MIRGNISAQLQVKDSNTVNEIGERINSYITLVTLVGYLDYIAGETKHNNYNSKIQESTHIFISDYVELDPLIKAENSRLIIDSKKYEIVLIDNPMNLNKHLEIYLKFVGG